MDALAAQLHDELDAEIPGIQIEGRMNINPSPDPVALDIYPGDPFQEPDAFGLGENDIMLTIRARVNTPDSEGAQDALLALMDPKAATSVEQAVLSDPSLSSTVGNLKIEVPPSNYGIFPDASGAAAFLGCTWTIRIIPGEGEPPVPDFPPTTVYDGNSASVAVGDFVVLEWVLSSINTGPEVLDLTDPQFPEFVSDGTYTISAWVDSGAPNGTATTPAYLEMDLWFDGHPPVSFNPIVMAAQCPVDFVGGYDFSVAATYQFAAGTPISIGVRHGSDQAETFQIQKVLIQTLGGS